MASVGEGAARGLESGFRLAMDMHARQRQDERLDRQDARQAGLDNEAAQDRARSRQRQDNTDEQAGYDRDEKDYKTLLQIQADNPSQNPLVAKSIAQRGQDLTVRRDAISARRDPGAAARTAQREADRKAVIDGTASPEVMVGHAEQTSGLPIQSFLRGKGPNGEPVPSAIDGAAQAIMSDNPVAKVKAFNMIYHSALQKGVGQAGRFPGTTILQKDVENVVPAPNSSDDDPTVIPTLRVWVKGGTPFNGPLPEGAPPGATGYYMAPMTEGRSADPSTDPTVKTIRVKDAMGRVDQLMQLGEAMNTPEGQAAAAKYKATQDAQGGSDPFAQVGAMQAQFGIKATPPVTTEKVIPRGAVLFEQTKDKSGKVLNERRIEGNASADTLVSVAQDEAAANGTSVAAEYAKLSAKKGRGGDDEVGEDGLTKGQKRRYDVGNTALNHRSTTLDNKEKLERDEYRLDLDEVKPDPMGDLPKVAAEKNKRRAEIRAEYKKTGAAHAAEREQINQARLTLETNSQGTPASTVPDRTGLATQGPGGPGPDGVERQVTPETQAARDVEAGKLVLAEAGGPASAPARLKKLRDAAANAGTGKGASDTKAIMTREADILEAAMKAHSGGKTAPAAAGKDKPPPAGKLTKDAAAAKFGF